MASNIHSHQHLMGPALMAGAHTENGVPSPQIFHFTTEVGWVEREKKGV